jgi:uncharacterized protein (UPF0128 family)
MAVLEEEESNFYENAADFIEGTSSYKEYKLATGRDFKSDWEEYEDQILNPFESDEELIREILEMTSGNWVVSYSTEEDGFWVYKVIIQTDTQIIAEALLEKEKAGSICPQLRVGLEKIKARISRR